MSFMICPKCKNFHACPTCNAVPVNEEEMRKADFAEVVRGASFLAAKDDAVAWAVAKAWKKGYFCGRAIQQYATVKGKDSDELETTGRSDPPEEPLQPGDGRQVPQGGNQDALPCLHRVRQE